MDKIPSGPQGMIQQYTSSLSKFPGRGSLITMETIFKYILFAIIAMVTNIGSQEAFITVYQGTNSLSYSVAIGTIIGLLVKYILDKRFIFNFHAANKIHTTRTFLLYSLMGLGTTIVFWGFEFSFDYLFDTKALRYIGAIIGLSIGYYLKYRLDKKFVFAEHRT